MITGSIHKENIIIINIYATNLRANKYMKQTLIELRGKIDNNKIIIGYFNATLSIINRTTRENISKEIRLDQNYRPIGAKRFIQNPPSNNSRIYILLKCTWNILQDRLSIRSQNKS